jgi:simple sugar transport system ATP-binding protein
MRPATGGRVRVLGRPLRNGEPRSAISRGVAYIPEDRLGTGVAPGLSVASNVVLKAYRRPDISRGPFLRFGRIRELAQRIIEQYDVRTSSPEVPAWQLSGGNLQKVVLGREFSGDPALLIAASPTRGLDVAAIASVHSYLREAAANGVAVLLLSEDLDEILVLADRVAVMYEGRFAGERDVATATVEDLGLLMAGGGESA